MTDFYPTLLELIIKASTELPEDVTTALKSQLAQEENGSTAASVLETLLENIRLANERQLPLCQDTGTIHFFVTAPDDFPRRRFKADAERAVVEATRRGLLRQNCVESVTGHNTGNNLGYVNPTFHWEEADDNAIPKVTVLLKGGGSENVGIQYSLPDEPLHAGRDLDGVKKCILDAVYRAQGKGCAPGILGVCIGGDRAGSAEEAKRQLLRRIGERSNDSALANLEQEVLAKANALGIGPMGLGGKTTLLDVFVGTRTRHPASYFVTVCYNCWCMRRQTLEMI
ncbi:MAG: fumarate hydratase [Victivallales bacterium]|nr:fumarate hydratase [Victivallales bacterium]